MPGPRRRAPGSRASHRSSLGEVVRHDHDVDHGRDGDSGPAGARREGTAETRIDGVPGDATGQSLLNQTKSSFNEQRTCEKSQGDFLC
jgi:hypothetical protein